MFTKLKKQVQKQFEILSQQPFLFVVDINRDKIFEEYLNGFEDPQERQGHNCNCCKSFLRQYGGIVAIIDGFKVSIWDNIVPTKDFVKPVFNLSNYIHTLPIRDVFINDFAKCGTDKNLDSKDSDVIWNHFYIELPSKFIKRKDDLDTLRSEWRTDKEVFKRALNELTFDAIDTTLELIAQKSLYRGNEFEASLLKFKEVKEQYETCDSNDVFAWEIVGQLPKPVIRIRNTSIGTLLIDLSEGVELDEAVTKFERVVAPTNYKRPTSLVTPKMVEQAKEKLEELGLTESIERRHATISDISIEDILYREKKIKTKDVFAEIASEVTVNPKTLSKVEEISIADFIEKILPTSKSIEVLLENNHLSNLVSIVTGEHKKAPSLFKWDNGFSWSYTGGITDSMKERVKAAGGKVDGVLRFSIQWNEDGKSIIDLDAHAQEPGARGESIYYGSAFRKDRGCVTSMGGQLDVDMINPSNIGIENITWPSISKMANGAYKFKVHNYSGHLNFDGVRCEIEIDGEVHEFSYNKPFKGYLEIANVTYSKANGFTIESLLPGKQTTNSKSKWGVNTNQFVKVKQIMLSPNYWNVATPTGNKHFFFMLEGCVSDELTRPFFNEFFKNEFNENRKVFEVLASKLRIANTPNQLSGVGFSETQRNSLIVRVEGKFKRLLKINF